MANRIHLRDYTVEELRAMPAGHLKDWLAAQVFGYKVGRMLDTYNIYNGEEEIGYWDCYEEKPFIVTIGDWRFSRNWSAAGRLLEWLMKESGEAGVQSDNFDTQKYMAWYYGGCDQY